jgi:hypothetical protein
LRKEDIFSVALKLYSIILMLSLLANYLQMKVIVMVVWTEEMSRNSELLLTPYNLWIVINGMMLFFIIYIWYRANKVLVIQSSIDFKSGAYLILGFYWTFIGIYSVHRFVITTYSEHRNQFNASFGSDLFFNGLGIFMVGGMILGYWFRRVRIEHEYRK